MTPEGKSAFVEFFGTGLNFGSGLEFYPLGKVITETCSNYEKNLINARRSATGLAETS